MRRSHGICVILCDNEFNNVLKGSNVLNFCREFEGTDLNVGDTMVFTYKDHYNARGVFCIDGSI